MRLIESPSLRRQQHHPGIPAAHRFDRGHQRLGLHHHPWATAVGRIVHRAMPIRRPFAQIVHGDLGDPPLLRYADEAFAAEGREEHREDRDHVDAVHALISARPGLRSHPWARARRNQAGSSSPGISSTWIDRPGTSISRTNSSTAGIRCRSPFSPSTTRTSATPVSHNSRTVPSGCRPAAAPCSQSARTSNARRPPARRARPLRPAPTSRAAPLPRRTPRRPSRQILTSSARPGAPRSPAVAEAAADRPRLPHAPVTAPTGAADFPVRRRASAPAVRPSPVRSEHPAERHERRRLPRDGSARSSSVTWRPDPRLSRRCRVAHWRRPATPRKHGPHVFATRP